MKKLAYFGLVMMLITSMIIPCIIMIPINARALNQQATSGTLHHAKWDIEFDMTSSNYGGIRIEYADFEPSDTAGWKYRIINNAWQPAMQSCVGGPHPLDLDHLVVEDCYYDTGDPHQIHIEGHWVYDKATDGKSLDVKVIWKFYDTGYFYSKIIVENTHRSDGYQIFTGTYADIDLIKYNPLVMEPNQIPEDDTTNGLYFIEGETEAYFQPVFNEMRIEDEPPYLALDPVTHAGYQMWAKCVITDNKESPTDVGYKLYIGHLDINAYGDLWPNDEKYFAFYDTQDGRNNPNKRLTEYVDGESLEYEDSSIGWWGEQSEFMQPDEVRVFHTTYDFRSQPVNKFILP